MEDKDRMIHGLIETNLRLINIIDTLLKPRLLNSERMSKEEVDRLLERQLKEPIT